MKFKLKPIFKDIFLTFVAQAIVLVAFFFFFRLVGRNFGQDGLGRFCLVRRVVAFLLPPLFLGLSVGLPRYIAISKTKSQRSGYTKAAILLVFVFTFVFLIVMNLFKNYFAKILFGNAEYVTLISPLSFLLSGMVLHTLAYSYFRGQLRVKAFNFVHITNIAVIPLVILILFKDITIENLIIATGIATFAASLVFFLSHIREILIPSDKGQFTNSLKELLVYSLPRVPGDFALAGLFSLGPIFAAHLASTREVGYLSLSISLLNMVATAIKPVSIILLPKISSVLVDGKIDSIKENIDFLIGAVLQCSLFISVQLLIFADVLAVYWLGPEFMSAVPAMRIILTSMTFYAFYVTIRSVLDAVRVKPLNTINLFISLAVFLSGSGLLLYLGLFSTIICLSIALTSGLMCLGILTYVSIRKIHPGGIKKDLHYSVVAILVGVLLGGVAIFSKKYISLRFHYLVAFEVLLTVSYFSILWLLRAEWLRQLPERMKMKIQKS